MKKLIILFLAVCSLWLLSCEEIPPVINPIDPNPGGGEVQRNVLVEEYTGVRCVNCPAGSEALQALINIYGERLVVVSFHAGFFAPPYSESKFDLRTADGDNLLNFLGSPLGYPAAVVNRKLFDSEPRLQLGQGQWPGYIAQEIAIAPKVKVELQRNYNDANRQLNLTVNLEILETLDATDVRLSVALTEDDIEDVQLTPTGKQADYKHKHVLRDMLSNFDGNPLTESLSVGAKIAKNFTYTIPADWNADKCKLVAFVHIGGDKKDVLQVAQVKVIQ
ncbi:MAG: Omp28 family outer membrane lipoprotein [Saprospiraceae bacterium]|nr:Omp28 family outer membrane lipoprotein [Saprospiraceae bacterium]